MSNKKSIKGYKLIAVLAKTQGRCGYCGTPLSFDDISENKFHEKLVGASYPTVDHIIPISRGGTDDLENLMPACHSCNSSKHNRPLEEWRRACLKKQGMVFSLEQIEYLRSIGVQLPPPPKLRFYFELHQIGREPND